MKLVVCIMGQDCYKFIKMCYESVKDADAIVFCDGGSSDGTIEYLQKQGFNWEPEARGNKTLIYQKFDKLDPKMNGRQRNYYLDYIKSKYPNDWCLCIDADEVVEDLNKMKTDLQPGEPIGVHSVKMRHFIGDLGHEDSTQPEHYVPNRLFRIKDADQYPEVEHPVLISRYKPSGKTTYNGTTIWHLAYVPNLWEIKNRYEGHKLKSQIHTPQYLDQWYRSHLFGLYPKKALNLMDIPKVILNEFGIDKDELYFANRGLETKHFIDAKHWKDFFKCKTAAEWGCGMGPRVYAMNTLDIDAQGWELSDYAVKHKIHENVIRADITKHSLVNPKELVIAYDLLEHIPYDKLESSINNLIKSSEKYLLVSVPVLGDPNLDADPTHIIKETKEWWINKFLEKGLTLVETPKHFLFSHQLIILEKPKHLNT